MNSRACVDAERACLATTLVILIAVAGVRLVAQSEPSLRELANMLGGQVHENIDACGGQPPFSALVARADLIIDGVVTRRTAYLTRDERQIFTDFEFAIRRVLFQKQVFAAPKPGLIAPIVFKAFGGHVVIDGLDVSVDANYNGVAVTAVEGDHVIVFGSVDPSDGKCRFFSEDVFNVSDAGVKSAATLPDLESPISYESFVQKIAQLRATPKP